MSTSERTRQFVVEIYRRLLGREPDAGGLRWAIEAIQAGADPIDLFLDMAASDEAVARQRSGHAAPLFVPPGHFYSPIVDPERLRVSGHLKRSTTDELLAVGLSDARQQETFQILARHFSRLDFPEQKSPSYRYCYDNEFFSHGDAITLASMLREHRPRRIIEVGCGYSTAAILDVLDQEPDMATGCTLIEPNTQRLRALLRPADINRVRLLEYEVQDAPLCLFTELEAGDFLLLDTTHVSKTGSDLNHEVFQVLPRLRPGVVIHFHDVLERFEYIAEWAVADNRSWNEAYLLRAFLMFNTEFEILFMNRQFCVDHPEIVRDICPLMLRVPGGGLWMRRVTGGP